MFEVSTDNFLGFKDARLNTMVPQFLCERFGFLRLILCLLDLCCAGQLHTKGNNTLSRTHKRRRAFGIAS